MDTQSRYKNSDKYKHMYHLSQTDHKRDDQNYQIASDKGSIETIGKHEKQNGNLQNEFY